MPSEDIERRLAAILSADVVGYSRLMAEDEQATIRTLTTYRTQVTELVEEHRGRVVDSPGDNVLAEFPTALDAVEAAIEIQRVLKARNKGLPESRRMEFRIGVHLGDVSVQDGRVYGDGVNIAARLEGLAEAGGICVSGAVQEQVRSKVDEGFEDLGDQEVKNIPEPVRVYRLTSDMATKPAKRRRSKLKTAALHTSLLLAVIGLAIWLSWPRPLGLVLDFYGLSELPSNPALPDEPSLVVLPFDNLSGDPGQDYLAHGLTEDLTARLVNIDHLFVISRNTAEAIKERAGTIEAIGKALGVRYVLEGSVRRAGNRVRVTAQLIEAATDHHLWSERYDRELEDIFALQAEIAEELLLALSPQILEAELKRVRRVPTDDLSAYEVYLKGIALGGQNTRRTTDAASEFFAHAIEIDPDFADAHAALGAGLFSEYGFGWSNDPELLDRAEALARRAISIDSESVMGHAVLAGCLTLKGQLPEARASAEKAAALAPGHDLAQTQLALVQLMEGSILPALQSLQKAVRVDPDPLPGMLGLLGALNYRAGRVDKAIELYERARAGSPDFIAARLALIHIYETVGRSERLADLAREVLETNPNFTIQDSSFSAQTLVGDPEPYFAALRVAGLPDEREPTPTDLSSRPSIIVLPFDNLSGDPEQESFADGITEDLTTALARTRDLMVLSRNTAFTYKGQAVKPQALREELGVRYVVEGSVRRGGDRIRINAQLIDAESGAHAWGEKYDRELKDIFEVQSQIVETILGRLNVEISGAELRRMRRTPTTDMSAYEAYIKGRAIAIRFPDLRPDETEEARRLAELALDRDPDFASAYVLLASTYFLELVTARDLDDALLDSMEDALNRALQLDLNNADAHTLLAVLLANRGRLHDGLRSADRAVELAPSLARGHNTRGNIYVFMGRWREAEQSYRAALQINPRFSAAIWMWLGLATYQLGRTEDGIEMMERSLRGGTWRARWWLIDTYERRGQHEAAQELAREAIEADPDITAERAAEDWQRGLPIDDPSRMLAHLREAGLP